MLALDPGLHLPGFIWPTWSELITGTEVMVLPQIPLTLRGEVPLIEPADYEDLVTIERTSA